MSKDAAKAAAMPAASAPKKSKKLLIILLAAVLVLVLGGGGAALLLLKKGGGADADEEEVETAPVKKAKKGKEAHPTFVNLEPFTVNLAPENGDQYLQVTLSVEFEEAAAEESTKLHMPKIRNNVTLLLSGKKASELLSKEGKEHLAAELLSTINEVLEPPSSDKKGKKSNEGPAKAVLFTSFIIQ